MHIDQIIEGLSGLTGDQRFRAIVITDSRRW